LRLEVRTVNGFCPKRRVEGVKVEEFQGEVLVYDLQRHAAHCLNGIAVSVWHHADGSLSVAEIATRIVESGGQADEAVVWQALEELDRASLLVAPLADAPVDQARRQMLGKLGWAAAIPFVLSITVPTPAYAQTGSPTAIP
jgi:hypothetical protein